MKTVSELEAIENEVWTLLEEVDDPEIGINIVDMGMIYGIHVEDKGITLDITLTSMGCPLKDLIEEQILNVLGTSEKIVSPIWFNWVFEPLWVPAYMSDEGREQLTALGGYIPTY